MPNGSNCALNHGAQLNSYSGCIKTELLLQNYCYSCANDMLAIHYIGDIREWQ